MGAFVLTHCRRDQRCLIPWLGVQPSIPTCVSPQSLTQVAVLLHMLIQFRVSEQELLPLLLCIETVQEQPTKPI